MITALPKLQALVELFIVEYTKACISKMKKENRDAIDKAIKEHSQIDLEKLIGSSQAGKPSGDDGAVIVDDPVFLHKEARGSK